MGSRNISLKDSSYERLRSRMRPGESFSDVVDRLAGQGSILDLVGIIPPESVDKIEAAIEASRAERIARRRKELNP
jgi:predicted CopG family antitoxin